MDDVYEERLLNSMVKNFARSSLQLNKYNQSDAELIKIPGTNTIIALTTDSIVEEIETGLYSDPFMIGWMLVTVNVSDLTAVGAKPIGILLNETFPLNIESCFLAKLQEGINAACKEYDICVLGGDTNHSTHMQMSACAIGIIDMQPITRMGCNTGDAVFISGKLGLGNQFAISVLLGGENNKTFKPLARFKEGQILRRYATSCIDSSDGFIASMDQLLRLNEFGFRLLVDLEQIILDEALEKAKQEKIPSWFLLAGIHGEFELVFTIPTCKKEEFKKEANLNAWYPIEIGVLTKPKDFILSQSGLIFSLNTSKIRNLFFEVNGDIEAYVEELFLIDNLIGGINEK